MYFEFGFIDGMIRYIASMQFPFFLQGERHGKQ